MHSRRQKVKGVIFDLDGTLIDSLGAFAEALNRAIKLFGLEPITDERVAHFLDKGSRLSELLLELFPTIFQDAGKRTTCENEIRKAYIELEKQKVLLKAGARRTLQLLKERGIKTGIVTRRMTTGENKWQELQRLNIRHLVDVMVTAADALAKPAPDGLAKCTKQLGLSMDECVFVGDSTIDVMAGKKAGIRTIAVHTGVASKDLLAELQPDRIIPDLSMLILYLNEL